MMFRSHWLNVNVALIGQVLLRRCEKNRSRFHLLAKRRKKPQQAANAVAASTVAQ